MIIGRESETHLGLDHLTRHDYYCVSNHTSGKHERGCDGKSGTDLRRMTSLSLRPDEEIIHYGSSAESVFIERQR